jgi:pyrroline-5-carboxylate reductase
MESAMNKIGFIGAGNVSKAIITGMAKNKFELDRIYINSKSNESKEKLSMDLMIKCAKNNVDLVKKCKYIFLAIKSQHYGKVLNEIKDVIEPDRHVLVSLAPGYSIEECRETTGIENLKVLRAMPNIPSLVGEGMTGIYYAPDVFTDIEKKEVEIIFNGFGEVQELDEEDHMDTLVSISASSPAYVYIMIEAMGDAGVLTGLPRKMSYNLAAQAVMGAAKMVKELDMHPGELKDSVCSPGGTTIEAVKVLEDRGFRSALIESMLACYNKVKELKR